MARQVRRSSACRLKQAKAGKGGPATKGGSYQSNQERFKDGKIYHKARKAAQSRTLWKGARMGQRVRNRGGPMYSIYGRKYGSHRRGRGRGFKRRAIHNHGGRNRGDLRDGGGSHNVICKNKIQAQILKRQEKQAGGLFFSGSKKVLKFSQKR